MNLCIASIYVTILHRFQDISTSLNCYTDRPPAPSCV